MSIHLGDEAPNFTADTTEGKIDFHEWKNGSWAVLFSHPADFTPVCTTELGRTAGLHDEFEKRGVKTIAVSVDSVEDHKGWAPDIKDVGGIPLNFPIIADPDRKVSELYDMIHPGEGDTSTVRSVFIIDPSNKVRLTLTYPKSVGRNFDEILRVVDALQLTDAQPGLHPRRLDTRPARDRGDGDVDRGCQGASSARSKRSSPTSAGPPSRRARAALSATPERQPDAVPPVDEVTRLTRRGLRLAQFTVAYNVVEGVLAVSVGLAAGLVSLVGFGLDSAIESVSAVLVGLRLSARLRHGAADPVKERRALRGVAISFFVLAGYVVVEGGRALVSGAEPESSPFGLAILGVSSGGDAGACGGQTARGARPRRRPAHSHRCPADRDLHRAQPLDAGRTRAVRAHRRVLARPGRGVRDRRLRDP